MQVSFTLTPDDLRRVWQWARTPPLTLFLGVAAWLVAVTGLLGFLSRGASFSLGVALLTSPVVIVSWWVQSRRLGQGAAAGALASDASLTGPRVLRLERDGIHDRRTTRTETYPWPQIRGCHRDSRYILIHVEYVGVIPIPFRAFAQRKDAELFWTALPAYKMSGGEAAVAYPADETVWPPAPTSGPPRIGG